jgi:DNA-binding transcriptional MerR regulator
MHVPDKMFYTIGDVSQLTGTKPHVLRYWESKFKVLRPARRYSGHRKYSQKDIDLINRIRYLIVDKKFTLHGARREILRQLSARPEGGGPTAMAALPLLHDIKREIDACLEIVGPSRESAD